MKNVAIRTSKRINKNCTFYFRDQLDSFLLKIEVGVFLECKMKLPLSFKLVIGSLHSYPLKNQHQLFPLAPTFASLPK